MRTKISLIAGMVMVSLAGSSIASIETVAGIMFDTANSVQTAAISTDGVISYSLFSANVAGPGGTADPTHHVGSLLSIGDSLAIDITAGANGAGGRNYITLTWGPGNVVENQPGDDFHIFESGTANPSNRGFPELFGVAVRESGSSTFTGYRYEFFNGSDVAALKLVTSYDITDFGLPSGAFIDAVQIISMHNASATGPTYFEDRVDNASGEGNVLLDAGSGTGFQITQGPNSDSSSLPDYPDSAIDADIVYVVSTNVTNLAPSNVADWVLY